MYYKYLKVFLYNNNAFVRISFHCTFKLSSNATRVITANILSISLTFLLRFLIFFLLRVKGTVSRENSVKKYSIWGLSQASNKDQ
jgi:hypothetical protein